MGIFNKLFNSSSELREEKVLPWQALTELSQLDEIEQLSKGKTQLIFKHSTRCSISRMVMNQFVTMYDLDLNADLYYLDLLNYCKLCYYQYLIHLPVYYRLHLISHPD